MQKRTPFLPVPSFFISVFLLPLYFLPVLRTFRLFPFICLFLLLSFTSFLSRSILLFIFLFFSYLFFSYISSLFPFQFLFPLYLSLAFCFSFLFSAAPPPFIFNVFLQLFRFLLLHCIYLPLFLSSFFLHILFLHSLPYVYKPHFCDQ